MDERLESFFDDAPLWRAELARLRDVLAGCGLTEEFKWRLACYTSSGRNIAILQPMKDHLSLMFFKGALLEDAAGLLERPGDNSRAARRVLFRSEADVADREEAVRAYVRAAIEVEEAGLTVPDDDEIAFVDELVQRLEGDPALKAAFFALTPGRQRAYNLHFSAPKQAATRERRIDRHVDRILAGKGMRD